MFEKDETIDVGDIVLRHYHDDDIPSLIENINDRAITRYTMHIPHPYSRKDALDFLKKNEKWFQDGTHLNLAITQKEKDQAIGGIGLMNIEDKFNHAEIGYWLGKTYWKQGIITRCVQAMVRYGFDRLGLQRISAVIFSPNERSANVLVKNGFIHEGTMRDRYVLDGKPIDGEMYALVSRDHHGQ